MKELHTLSTLSKTAKKKLVKRMPNNDAEIDTSDAPPLPPELWAKAVQGKFYRPVKESVHVRVDADVLEWLRRQGPGHLTRINRILRETMIRDLSKRSA